MIVAAVGHVDHGKTSLVKALTGVDTDRLAEEKRRGMSIELGFAYRRVGGAASIGFIDVPGHERFVHTMAAGVAGIAHALVVVAADDGLMPQTLEHLAILDLFDVRSSTLAISKVDRASPERIAEVTQAADALLARRHMQRTATFAVSATTGAGVDRLASHLDALAARQAHPAPRGLFRMPVDRSFVLNGVGVVVTGTVLSGGVSVGDAVVVSPRGLEARVRSVRAQDQETERAQAGDRCALNLVGPGVDRGVIVRGDWIAAAEIAAPTDRVDVALRLMEGQELPRDGRVHVHLGARDATARVVPLGARFAQIVFDEPVAALWGDRLVLRDWAAAHTLGGGTVVDPWPPSRGRSAVARLKVLSELEKPGAPDALAGLLELQPNGVDLERLAVARNLADDERAALMHAPGLPRAGAIGFAPAHWAALDGRILAAIQDWHAAHPDGWGITAEQLGRKLGGGLALPVLQDKLSALVARSALARRGVAVLAHGHRPQLAVADRRIWERIAPMLDAAGAVPPSLGNLKADLGDDASSAEDFLRRAARLGFVVAVARNRFYTPAALRGLAKFAARLADETPDGFTTAQFRDRTGVGRNLAVKVLEYFDRIGLTRRAGDVRRMLRDPADVFGRQEDAT